MQSSMYLILGLGKTGHSIARFLKRRNQSFAVFDTRSSPAGLTEFNDEFPGIPVFLEHLPEDLYPQITTIISSPGVALDHPMMQHAMLMGIPIIGDVECLARAINVPVIAITGTNGKSTVTTLVGEMAKASGLNVAVAGNIGTPVLDLLDNGVAYDLWVLELSSFQLDLIYSLMPISATILNISPDHLDRHHSMDAYIQAKHRIYHQAQFQIYNREDISTIPHENQSSNAVKITSFGLNAPTSAESWGIIAEQQCQYLAFGSEKLLSVDDLLIKGQHNWANALAACALAHAAGIDFLCMIEVLKRFSGLPHRSQWVRSLNNVGWVNDSKGTNIGATISAISGIGGSLQGRIVLIAGGQGKGADFSELRASMSNFVRSVVLIGQDADLIETALTGVLPVLRATSLEEAVIVAKNQAQSGDIVLLSPACASLDMFRDFNHRGEVFTAIVNGL